MDTPIQKGQGSKLSDAPLLATIYPQPKQIETEVMVKMGLLRNRQ
jgi:hypothetical protein